MFYHTLKFRHSRLGLPKVHLWGDPEKHTTFCETMFTCNCISKFIQEFCWLDRQIHVHVPHLSAVPVCLVFAAWHLQDLCQGRPQWSKSGQKSSPKRVSCNSNTEILRMCVYICACISDFSEKMDQSNKWFFFTCSSYAQACIIMVLKIKSISLTCSRSSFFLLSSSIVASYSICIASLLLKTA